MALIQCPECHGQVSSKASTCPHCGCPIEISNFEFINIGPKDGNELVRYIELANSALNGCNGQEAYDYANRALEIDPININALEIKMQSLQYIGTLANLRIPEVIECGTKIIQHSPVNFKDLNQQKVYAYYLNRALDLLNVAINHTKDTDSIKKTFERFALISIFTCGDNTLHADAPFIQLMEGLVVGALELKSQVPINLIHDDATYQTTVVNISNAYEQYTQALVDRYKIYGAELTQSALDARTQTLNALSAGRLTQEELQSQALVLAQEYWAAHPVEKQEFEQKINHKRTQKQLLLTERQTLKIFNMGRKKEIQQEIEILDAEIAALQNKLDFGP